MVKWIFRSAVPAVLLAAALFACGNRHTAGGQLTSLKDIIVNGPGVDGSVHEIRKVMYTLKDLHKGQNYTLRTEIGLFQDETVGTLTSDGTLTVDIYSSADAYASNPTTPVTNAASLQGANSNIYEVNFFAPSAGDYVVVISGESKSVPGIQFFYNLRIMSADSSVDPSVITATLTPSTSVTGTTYEAAQTNPLNPGYLNIYNGGNVASSGVYTISLVSNATPTTSYPQIFVYLDSRMTLTSLILSSIPTTTNFIKTTFIEGVPDTTEQLDADIITGVTFTSSTDSSVTGTAEGPFIVLKGFINAVTYTLSVSP